MKARQESETHVGRQAVECARICKQKLTYNTLILMPQNGHYSKIPIILDTSYTSVQSTHIHHAAIETEGDGVELIHYPISAKSGGTW